MTKGRVGPRPRAGRMRAVHAILCAAAAILMGCSRASNEPIQKDGAMVDVDADTVLVTGAAAEARSAPDGRPFQYRAVCLEGSQHPQPIFVLSRWVEDFKVPWDLGEYHGSWKAKGHHWVVQRRVKPPVGRVIQEVPAVEPHADTAAMKSEAH